MLIFQNKYLSFLININKYVLIGFSFIALFLLFLPLFPPNSFIQLIEFVVYFSPRWVFFIVLLPSFIFFMAYKLKYRLMLVFCFLVYLYHQDFHLNIFTANDHGDEIKVMSLNIGGGFNSKYLKNALRIAKPDVVLLQEARIGDVKDVFPDTWLKECIGGLCLASKYKFKRLGEFDRKIISGWGHFANYYELSINGKSLPIMNIHLETPRNILSNVINLQIDWHEVSAFNDKKSIQSTLIEAWVDGQDQFIIAGDFNMTKEEQLFKQYFSKYTSVIEEAANGITYTKYTSWHGVRIDHILISDQLNVSKTKVLSSVGGDHRAILTTIILPQ